jgi:hypothetical protein
MRSTVWDSGGTPSEVIELQETGVDGHWTGQPRNRRIRFRPYFFMNYPIPFLVSCFPQGLSSVGVPGVDTASVNHLFFSKINNTHEYKNNQGGGIHAQQKKNSFGNTRSTEEEFFFC